MSDSDALAFATAAGITDSVQRTALDNLVIGLKADGIWTKLKAVYPFVGGTAASHKWNLKDPQDTDAAFRLVFSGGWTHSATGALPNGSTGYANTFFNPATQGLLYNDNHLSIYSRTSGGGGASNFYEMGEGLNTGGLALFARRTSDLAGYDVVTVPGNRVSAANTNGQGFYLGTANTATGRLYKNAALHVSAAIGSVAMPSYNVYIGGFNEQNSVIHYSAKETAWNSIGVGLTVAEASNLYTRVQAFQTALGRQV